MASEAAQILETVTPAAQAASEAARALKGPMSRAKLSKVVKCPGQFGNPNSIENQSMWLNFSLAFKQWLYYAEPGYESDLVRSL